MKISQDLPQFEERKSLLIVAGKQEAKIFFALNGEINKIRDINLSNPHYSDKEGFFEVRTRMQKLIRAGSVLKPLKWKIINEFNRMLVKELNDLIQRGDYDYVYIISPVYLHKIVEKEIPPGLKEKKRRYIAGDLCHKHPFDILRRLV